MLRILHIHTKYLATKKRKFSFLFLCGLSPSTINGDRLKISAKGSPRLIIHCLRPCQKRLDRAYLSLPPSVVMSQKTFRAFPFFSGSTQYSPSVLKCPAFRISLQDEAGWWEYKPSEKENLYNYVIQFYALRCIPNLEVHTKNTLLLLTVVWSTSFTMVSWVTQSALSLSFLITGNVDTGNLCVWKLSKLHQKTIFFSCCLRKTRDRREDPTIYICSKTRFVLWTDTS